MSKIDNIHDNFFKKIFSDAKNVKTFLEFVLPQTLREQLDLSEIDFDPTSYISEEFRPSLSDVVVKCNTKDKKNTIDIYILFEHKSYSDKRIFVQLQKSMHFMWQQDYDNKMPPRVIIPIVFYHGESEWKIPTQFIEQFHVSENIKPFLLDFKYILFDTNQWDWQAESSQPLLENIFLLSAMQLMKAASQQNLEIIRQVFRLWNQIGFIRENDAIAFFMIYIVQTQDVPEEQLARILKDNKLKGEDIMPTLAERWKDEGREEGREEGYVKDKQDVLIMLLSTRFQLNQGDKQIIKAVSDVEILNQALKTVLTADNKQDIFDMLKIDA